MARIIRSTVLVVLVALAALTAADAARLPATAADGMPPLVISEIRWRGAGGELDDYVELLNHSDQAHTVQGADGSAGYAVALSNESIYCTVPGGTVIPAHGHFLCIGMSPSSVSGYPSGSDDTVTSTSDATATIDLQDTFGVALFRTNEPDGFELANRVDAVGPTTDPIQLYREGAGLVMVDGVDTNGAWVRSFGTDVLQDPLDTEDNGEDFVNVNVAGQISPGAHRLGAPGPEEMSAPRSHAGIAIDLLDPCASRFEAPNLVRHLTPVDPPSDAAAGTVEVRRTISNHTGGDVTRLRFRIIDIRVSAGPSASADLRASSIDFDTVDVDRAPCGDAATATTVHGTLLEEPPAQDEGGGVNSSLSVSSVTPAQPLVAGGSIDVRLLLDVEQAGGGGLYVIPEVTTNAPGGSGAHPGACLTTTVAVEGNGDWCYHSAVAQPDDYAVDAGTTLVVDAAGVLANDYDPDQDVLRAQLAADPEHGVVELADDGSFTYVPDPGFVGSDSFRYFAVDGEATVTLTVRDAPAGTTTTTPPATDPPTTTPPPTDPPTTTPPATGPTSDPTTPLSTPISSVAPSLSTLSELTLGTEVASGDALPRTGSDVHLVAVGLALIAAGVAGGGAGSARMERARGIGPTHGLRGS